MTKHLSEQERREQILSAARDEFIRKGYASTRVEDVAKRASLSKGAVYFYFSSKRALFTALVLDEHERTYAFLDEAERDDRPALDKLLDVGLRYVTYFAATESPPRFFMMMSELGTRDGDIRDECQAVHQRFVDAVTRILAQGIAEGSFRPADPHATAQLLKAMIDGFAGQAAVGVPIDVGQLVHGAFHTLLRGILAKPGQADALVDRIAAVTGAP